MYNLNYHLFDISICRLLKVKEELSFGLEPKKNNKLTMTKWLPIYNLSHKILKTKTFLRFLVAKRNNISYRKIRILKMQYQHIWSTINSVNNNKIIIREENQTIHILDNSTYTSFF